jgi:hypothetical protein
MKTKQTPEKSFWTRHTRCLIRKYNERIPEEFRGECFHVWFHVGTCSSKSPVLDQPHTLLMVFLCLPFSDLRKCVQFIYSVWCIPGSHSASVQPCVAGTLRLPAVEVDRNQQKAGWLPKAFWMQFWWWKGTFYPYRKPNPGFTINIY